MSLNQQLNTGYHAKVQHLHLFVTQKRSKVLVRILDTLKPHKKNALGAKVYESEEARDISEAESFLIAKAAEFGVSCAADQVEWDYYVDVAENSGKRRGPIVL